MFIVICTQKNTWKSYALNDETIDKASLLIDIMLGIILSEG